MKAIKAFLAAVGFLTIFPLGNTEIREDDLASSPPFFPVIGAALGALLWCIALSLEGQVYSPVLAVLLSVLLAIFSGGLHWDGWADVFDGLGGGRGDRERMLRIMKDPSIGAHGATALILALMLQALLFHQILITPPLALLIAVPIIGRWSVIAVMMIFPYARQEGLGTPFKRDSGRTGWIGWFLITAATVAGIHAIDPRFVIPAGVAQGIALIWGLWLNRKLKGLTGDVYGATIVLAELAFMLTALSASQGPT